MKNIKATLISVKNGVSKYDLVYTNKENKEVEQKNMYSSELIDLLIEEIEQFNCIPKENKNEY
ncbi:MAG: hypothetical protein RSE19_06455 [Myroides sp.]